MPFHFAREMKNAQIAGKSDRPTTMTVAGPANAQPVRCRRPRPRGPTCRWPAGCGGRARGSAAKVSAMSFPHGVGGLLGRLVKSFLRLGRVLQDLGDRIADVAGQDLVAGDRRACLLD